MDERRRRNGEYDASELSLFLPPFLGSSFRKDLKGDRSQSATELSK